MKQQVKSIFLFSIALVVVALAAYALPTPAQPLPHRLLLPNTGGRVVFTHAAHVAMPGSACERCHHDLNIPERELSAEQKRDPALVFACGECHGTKETPGFKESHKARFAARNDGGASCVACHHTESLPEEPAPLTPQAVEKLLFAGCQECHTAIQGRMDAFHASCAGCHEKVKKGPAAKACQQCHTP